MIQPRSVNNHVEDICLNAIHTPPIVVILGLSWLQLHNPRVDWLSKEPIQWHSHCLQHCLENSNRVCATTVPEDKGRVPLPEEYVDFKDVFDKVGRTSSTSSL
ncbi:hypothetical protein FKM82_028914 [Ascaphus truei]